MICKYCGQNVKDDVDVCPCCGAHLPIKDVSTTYDITIKKDVQFNKSKTEFPEEPENRFVGWSIVGIISFILIAPLFVCILISM